MICSKKRHLNLVRHTKEKGFWTTTRQLTRLGKLWIDAMFGSTFMHLRIDFHSEFPNYIRIPAIREREDGKKKK